MSGSGGDTGYDYQADAIAYIAAHAITGQPLSWFTGKRDIPLSWSSETGGPGDDIRIHTTDGEIIELQAKHALTRGKKYNEALERLILGLKRSPSLRGALLIDHLASEVIRRDLLTDIIRLGQGRTDGLKPITTNLLDTLKLQADDQSLFSRLRLIVIDLELGAGGYATAEALLAQVVGPDKSPVTFMMLGKRGHQVIKARGADDAICCARFVENEIGIPPSAKSPVIDRLRFLTWSVETNSRFFSPAFQLNYPIKNAWSSLLPLSKAELDSQGVSTLTEEIERYQEWARLASPVRNRNEIDVQALIAREKHVAIVGGPGAGKTTLARKIVWLVSTETIALRARLPLVRSLMASGKGFHDAVAEVSCGSFGNSAGQNAFLLTACKFLVLDGLDECDPNRIDVAHEISAWATAHPSTCVCVLTRPVGHTPAMLPGFFHAELLPLGDTNVREALRVLFAPIISDSTERDKEVEQFITLVKAEKSRGAASIAARNPLLLSFLARLFRDREPLRTNRSELLKRIIEFLRKSPSIEKVHRSAMSPSSATAWAVAEIAGWNVLDKPQLGVSDICDRVARELPSTTYPFGIAEDVIAFWSRQGLLETITVGVQDALVFVHPSLGEFLAGRYIARQSDTWIEDQVSRRRRQPKWREPILLAAGCGALKPVIHSLLKLDNPSDPESSEAFLAAAALGETEDSESVFECVKAVAAALVDRLSSDVPLVALGAAVTLARLAPLLPGFMTGIYLQLKDNEREWTRFAAFVLGLFGDASGLSIQDVVTWVHNTRDNVGYLDTAWGVNLYTLKEIAIPRALRRIATELPVVEAEKSITEFTSREDNSVGILENIKQELEEEPYRTWISNASVGLYKSFAETTLQWHSAARESIDRQRLLMKILISLLDNELKVCAGEEAAPNLLNLGRLVSSMKLGDMVAGDLLSIREEDAPVLSEVFRGFVAGLPLKLAQLRAEAQDMAVNLASGDAHLLDALADVREPDPDAIASARLNVSLLATGILHRSQTIGWNSLRLLCMCELTGQDLDLLIQTFMKATHDGLRRCAYLIVHRTGDQAFSLLKDRWKQGPIKQCASLLEFLSEVAKEEAERQETIDICLEGLRSGSPRVAEKAAMVLRSFDVRDLKRCELALEEVFERWEQGSWCSRCRIEVQDYSCPNCHVVPPSPLENLVLILGGLKHFSFDGLLRLTEHPHDSIARGATTILIEWAVSDPAIESRVCEAINQGSVALFKEYIRALGTDLVRYSERLGSLLSSPSESIRSEALLTLDSGWMPADKAREVLLLATRDGSPLVRSAAARVLQGKGPDSTGRIVDLIT